MKRSGPILAVARLLDVIALPFTFLAAVWLKAVRTIGLHEMPLSKKCLLSVGLLPMRDHYYEPWVKEKDLRYPLDRDRDLPGVDLNDQEQLDLLARFDYRDELLQFPLEATDKVEYCYHNRSFESGDAEFLYNIVRHFKPRRILEIGSGHSTLMARNAIRRNMQEQPAYACEHTCIEPYEQPWLESLGIKILRKRVEEFPPEFFSSLEANDILFIDSSHVIRPQGDVLFEYLQILPMLKPGVIVHVHDIFTPRDYLPSWVLGEMRIWHEQYLLEAFLTQNSSFRVIGAVNYLKHHHPAELGAKCPVLEKEMALREPGSFWMIRAPAR
jgi:hypothetical protein